MRLSSNTRMPAPRPRKTVSFHASMEEPIRELADTLARRMGCSRSEAIGRAPGPPRPRAAAGGAPVIVRGLEHDCNAYCRGDEHCIVARTRLGDRMPGEDMLAWAREQFALVGLLAVRVAPAPEAAPPARPLRGTGGGTLPEAAQTEAWLVWVTVAVPGRLVGDMRRGEVAS